MNRGNILAYGPYAPFRHQYKEWLDPYLVHHMEQEEPLQHFLVAK